MGRMSREKGKRGERELAKELEELGYSCRRGQQYCGASGDADVVGLPGVHIECKRMEAFRMYDALVQAIQDKRKGELPVVMHRRNGMPWVAVMTLDDWMELYRAWDARQNQVCCKCTHRHTEDCPVAQLAEDNGVEGYVSPTADDWFCGAWEGLTCGD